MYPCLRAWDTLCWVVKARIVINQRVLNKDYENSNKGLKLYWDEVIRERKEVSSSHFVLLI